MTCSVESCYKSVIARGWCREHYYRWSRNGDPLGGRASQGTPMKWLTEHAQYKDDDCLIWPFRRGGRGYAYLADGPASRVMCEIAHGKAPSLGHEAAHSCGKGHFGCINPQHLRWATKQENESDKHNHGTRLVGSQLPWAKLMESQVREIRRLKGQFSQPEIAARFGVSKSTIGLILNNRIWRHV